MQVWLSHARLLSVPCVARAEAQPFLCLGTCLVPWFRWREVNVAESGAPRVLIARKRHVGLVPRKKSQWPLEEVTWQAMLVAARADCLALPFHNFVPRGFGPCSARVSGDQSNIQCGMANATNNKNDHGKKTAHKEREHRNEPRCSVTSQSSSTIDEGLISQAKALKAPKIARHGKSETGNEM